MNINNLIRKNIAALKPYSCARDEFKGEASAYLDANENPYNAPFNRYPDPLQSALKEQIAKIKNVRPPQIMLGNGSDEPIDLIFRIFCEPKQDNVVAIDPTYGMYQVCADVNDVEYRKVLLNDDYTLNVKRLLQTTDAQTKVVFLCSPNNPTGNLMEKTEILTILNTFQGIVVIDEAYVDFSPEPSWLNELDNYPQLIVLQTFSKAWGMASVRCGLAFASENIIAYFNKVKYPYNINLLTQNFVSERLNNESEKNEWVRQILSEREPLIQQLQNLPIVEKIYPSDANFLLVKVKDANLVYQSLVKQGVIVRNRHTVSLCGDCLRITVGTQGENRLLIQALGSFSGL
ncbi:MAG: histidinol-phosphate transaminase [Dysgonamonadaceae bacterium]|jgi:histidinol-phosphate aminotransferase|nr:histidinol-phosphate transaminase [Dysgonamonadaceae bacterium]